MRFAEFLNLLKSALEENLATNRCASNVFTRQVDSHTWLWVSVSGADGFATPLVGIVWPGINLIADRCSAVPFLNKSSQPQCGPPIVNEPLAKWSNLYQYSKLGSRADTSWFWNTQEQGRSAVSEIASGVRTFWGEWIYIWPTTEDIVAWVLSNRKFNNNTAAILPVFFAKNSMWGAFAEYTEEYCQSLIDSSAPDPAKQIIRDTYIKYVNSIKNWTKSEML